MNYPPPTRAEWSTGLYDCMNDCDTCCWGCWCPCVLVGKNVEVLDEGATSCCTAGTLFCLLQYCVGVGCIYTCIYRGRLRQKYGLPPGPCGDCLTDCCCQACSICQVTRELGNQLHRDRGPDDNELRAMGNRTDPSNIGVNSNSPAQKQYMNR
ncbi:hypothetical protein MPTK1_1g10640 [Marchantia polymorpha subsp. ruderalis]|uniref:Uncharacterized protein n=2 Tax=Marchantia polymorpha TaxID=3197 RepID=A0AAF6ANQ4_MARPO|nr:hypothetical protein MARPO_0014s0163 [Marchantia polymorpha]BBM98074.1 hypothetical protein Mp_1g10640 [Marchantia polymorpha subsp. ruderalis]|eukprot:PTQ45652.1 hypothetical protein MARPO_0014s0163 [Marchantia polymorpha]